MQQPEDSSTYLLNNNDKCKEKILFDAFTMNHTWHSTNKLVSNITFLYCTSRKIYMTYSYWIVKVTKDLRKQRQDRHNLDLYTQIHARKTIQIVLNLHWSSCPIHDWHNILTRLWILFSSNTKKNLLFNWQTHRVHTQTHTAVNGQDR